MRRPRRPRSRRTAGLLCEPGRALVAEGQSLVVQVILVKEDQVFLNDGIYGSLSEPGLSNRLVSFPVAALRPDGEFAPPRHRDFTVFGPTCDTLDVLPVTFSAAGRHKLRRLGRGRHSGRLQQRHADPLQRLPPGRLGRHRRAGGPPARRRRGLNAAPMVKVWDIFVRSSHWAVALGFFVAYLTEDDLITLHVWAGYLVGALVVLRLLWGFVGSQARPLHAISSPGRGGCWTTC